MMDHVGVDEELRKLCLPRAGLAAQIRVFLPRAFGNADRELFEEESVTKRGEASQTYLFQPSKLCS